MERENINNSNSHGLGGRDQRLPAVSEQSDHRQTLGIQPKTFGCKALSPAKHFLIIDHFVETWQPGAVAEAIIVMRHRSVTASRATGCWLQPSPPAAYGTATRDGRWITKLIRYDMNMTTKPDGTVCLGSYNTTWPQCRHVAMILSLTAAEMLGGEGSLGGKRF